MIADLNDDEDGDSVDDGIMAEFLNAVQLRLQEELKATTTVQPHLSMLLKNNDWVLLACHAKKYANYLNCSFMSRPITEMWLFGFLTCDGECRLCHAVLTVAVMHRRGLIAGVICTQSVAG